MLTINLGTNRYKNIFGVTLLLNTSIQNILIIYQTGESIYILTASSSKYYT